MVETDGLQRYFQESDSWGLQVRTRFESTPKPWSDPHRGVRF